MSRSSPILAFIRTAVLLQTGWLGLCPAFALSIPELIRQAMEARQRGDLSAAVAAYDHIVQLDPSSPEMWANRGILLYEAGRYATSIESLSRATALKPALAVPPLYRGKALLRLRRPREAQIHLRRALVLDPESLDAMLELADACAAAGEPAEALVLYRRVLDRRPAAAVWHRLGVLYLRWAKEVADRLLDPPTRSPFAKALLAERQLLLGDAQRAGALLREAAEALPEGRERELLVSLTESAGHPSPPLNPAQRSSQLEEPAKRRALTSTEELLRGESAYYSGRFEIALPALHSAFGLPGRGDYARFLFIRSCRELAKFAFEAILQEDPDSYLAHLVRAEAAESSGDNPAAIREYQRLLEIDASDPEQHLHYIRVLVAQRDLDGAREAGARAVQRFPDHPGLNARYGLVLLESGSSSEAIPYFEKALTAATDLVEARSGLADACAAQGDFRRAIEEIGKVLRADRDGSLHYRLGRWYAETGQDALSAKAFAEAERRKIAARAKPR